MHATFYALLCTLSTRAFLIGFLSKKALLESSKHTRQDSVAVPPPPENPLKGFFWRLKVALAWVALNLVACTAGQLLTNNSKQNA